MDQLLQYQHSHTNQSSRSKKSFIKQWVFTKDNIINILIYQDTSFDIKQAFTKDYSIHNKLFYIKVQKTYTCIYDIEDWVNKNIIYIENSEKNYNKCYELVSLISENIGENTFKTYFEIGWYIPNLLKLTIQLYDTNKIIQLNYKNKNTILSVEKAQVFIQKNKKVILKMQEKNKKEHESKMQETIKKQKEKQLLDKIELQKILDAPSHDATKKVGYTKNGSNFFIKKSLRDRYLVQACKPLPEKYEWL
jgi:hypothetical protein